MYDGITWCVKQCFLWKIQKSVEFELPDQSVHIDVRCSHTKKKNGFNSSEPENSTFCTRNVQSNENNLVLMQYRDYNQFHLIENMNNFEVCACVTQSPNHSDMPFDNYEIYYVPIVCTTFEPTILSSLLYQHGKWKKRKFCCYVSGSFSFIVLTTWSMAQAQRRNIYGFHCFCVCSLIELTFEQQPPTNEQLPRESTRKTTTEKIHFSFLPSTFLHLGSISLVST